MASPLDPDCRCYGNWRLILSECESLIGKRYLDDRDRQWKFFGLVHGGDDYYYGMYRDGQTILLSCVGDMEGHGYRLDPEQPARCDNC